MKPNKTFVIGITGRIATGKSSLAKAFGKYGFEVIDADEIYRKLFIESSSMRKELYDFFGTLDKSEILEKIISDKDTYLKLNAITHPYVERKIIDCIENDTNGRIVLDVPIPTRKGFIDLCDYIFCTDCSLDVQVERLQKRNGIERDEALERIGLQKDREEYIDVCDCVISTCGMNTGILFEIAGRFLEIK